MPDHRCVWSNRRDPGIRPITLSPGKRFSDEIYWVCREHEMQFRRFYERMQRHRVLSLTLVAGIVFGGLILSVVDSSLVTAAVFAGSGTVIIVYPFATPQTIHWLGVRTSVRVVRVAGFLMLAAGVYLFAWESIFSAG